MNIRDELAGLPNSLGPRLFALGREAEYPAGARPPNRDEGFEGIRLIGSGEVEVLARTDEGEVPVYHFGAGEALGVRDFLRPESEPRLEWRVLQDALLLEIPGTALRALLKEPDAAPLRNLLEHAAHQRDLEILMAIHPVFRRLDQEDRHRLFAAAEPRLLSDGEVLIEAGKANEGLYLVVEGELSVLRNGEPVGRRGAGEIIGEVSTLGFAPTADARARGWTEVLVFDRRQVLDLCDRNPEFAAELAHQGLSGIMR